MFSFTVSFFFCLACQRNFGLDHHGRSKVSGNHFLFSYLYEYVYNRFIFYQSHAQMRFDMFITIHSLTLKFETYNNVSFGHRKDGKKKTLKRNNSSYLENIADLTARFSYMFSDPKSRSKILSHAMNVGVFVGSIVAIRQFGEVFMV